ncbi:mtDNA inheritance, partitioning of the mitochondrial organelle [Coemansia biformis]|uniref:MtDNA inheritance, partitioning of the mitochondrial organelle n=1 Tax=Coemansia biformis TaxID=1286918 RepID=A0A9W7YI35_9FUNG|nr:mtDNA inheritance, partitioning of the mitochondrial organelle [Coemansia biformis]
MREVITLQFGGNANFVGAHFWNLQLGSRGDDSVPELFCERSGTPAVPRALVFDTPGNFGALGRAALQSAGSDADDMEHALWNGATEVHRQPLCARAEPGAPGGARYWSDVCQARFAAHALGAVTGVEFGNSLGEMNTFQEGSQVFAGSDRREDALEGGFRVFAEECDRLQGFQVLCDAFGGFAGYGAGFMGCVRDEYPKAPVVLYSVGHTQRIGLLHDTQLMDAAVAAASALDTASMSVPLFVPPALSKLRPHVHIEDNFLEISGLLAANVAQWSYSLRRGQCVLDEVVAQVTQQGYYTTAETLLAPGLHIPPDAADADGIVERSFVGCSDAAVRGLASATGLLVVDRGTRMGDAVAATCPGAARAGSNTAAELPRAFPPIFRGVDARGFLADRPVAVPAERLAVAGLLCTSPASLGYLQQLRSALQAEHGRHFKDYELETLRELGATLDTAVDRYRGSDSDGD